MQRLDIEQQIRSFVTDSFLFGQPIDLQSTDSLLAKGVIDSTGVLELVSFLESTYAIKIKDEDIIPENLDSIHDISEFVFRKLGCLV
ncbi:MAG TPA: acyl carrier protein [Acidobacteriaceae bacterium]